MPHRTGSVRATRGDGGPGEGGRVPSNDCDEAGVSGQGGDRATGDGGNVIVGPKCAGGRGVVVGGGGSWGSTCPPARRAGPREPPDVTLRLASFNHPPSLVSGKRLVRSLSLSLSLAFGPRVGSTLPRPVQTRRGEEGSRHEADSQFLEPDWTD